ncbi:MAG: right-handed parallel beta-helix repeat-containing protein [Candidatus Thorarchaeota archaeon]
MMKRVVATLLLVSILVLSSIVLSSETIEPQSAIIRQSSDYTPSQYQTSEPIVISSDADFATLGFPGSGTLEDPYIIANLSISSSSGSSIWIQDTTAYFIIYNCFVEASSSGQAIWFENVQNGQIMSSEISGGDTGIVLRESSYCTVSNTLIYYASSGIYLYSSNNCTIIFSRLYNNYIGAQIESATFCNILNSSIYSNTRQGLDLIGSSFNNSIVGNSIGWNGDIGNVIDLGRDNRYDDGIGLGNAWDDFNGTIPFVVPGTNGSIDSFPVLLEDNVNPVVYGLADFAFDVESTGNSMTWMVSDEFPSSYSIQIDSGPEAGHVWNGDDITINLDTLRIGTYRFVVTLYDGAGNTASDEVYVSSVSFVLGGIGTELVVIASGLTVAYFTVIIFMVKKLS